MHDLFPVICLPHDDLIESTSGYEVRCLQPDHPMVRALDWRTLPALLGFNETSLRPGSQALVEINNQGAWYPLLAVRSSGAGTTASAR